MAEPWPIVTSTVGDVKVRDADGCNAWFPHVRSARRYAALPVLIATIREACADSSGFTPTHCRFCEREDEGDDEGVIHNPDCPGIAALKAAGEEIE